MKRYRVVHKTAFSYNSLAVSSYNEARMLPARDEGQVVFSSKLEITPGGSNFEFHDYFDTRVVFFEALEPHNELSIVADSLVELRPYESESVFLDWPELAEQAKLRLDLCEYLLQTRRTKPPADLAKFAAKQSLKLQPQDTALAICQHIYEKVKYQSGITGVHSVATEAWRKEVGVCQDFAHLVIGALRHIGIPARYVSGYLHPSSEPKKYETVQGESHAWVEWFTGSWQAFDPTNAVEVIDRHVMVGRGRDYDDVPPLRGVFAGAESSELSVSVELTREL